MSQSFKKTDTPPVEVGVFLRCMIKESALCRNDRERIIHFKNRVYFISSTNLSTAVIALAEVQRPAQQGTVK